MDETITFTVRVRGKKTPKQINIPLKTVQEQGIKADELFKVTLERIAEPQATTQEAVQAKPEETPAA